MMRDSGYVQPRYIMYVRVQITDTRGGGLIDEDYTLEADSFLTIAKILGQFHDLAVALKETKND